MTPNKRLREKVARALTEFERGEGTIVCDFDREMADIAIRIVIDEVRERLSDMDTNP